MEQLLIVEDDPELNKGLCKALRTPERQTVSCYSILEAKQQIDCMVPALVLLDSNLPDGSGLELLREWKERFPQLLIVMLTANDTDSDIVEGLKKGVDDYITKPFSLAVLRARIETQLKRRQGGIFVADAAKQQREGTQSRKAAALVGAANAELGQPEKGYSVHPTNGASLNPMNGDSLNPANRADAAIFRVADYVFDFRRMVFTVAGQAVELSKTEQKALRILVENQGFTVSREQMIDLIWTDGAEFVESNALSVTMKRLRDKLQAGQYIKTVYGLGYKWEKA